MDVPRARLPSVVPLLVVRWGLLGSTSPEQVRASCWAAYQGSLWPVHVISSQPEQTSFVLKNACLPVTAEACFWRKSYENDDGKFIYGTWTSLVSNLDWLWSWRP